MHMPEPSTIGSPVQPKTAVVPASALLRRSFFSTETPENLTTMAASANREKKVFSDATPDERERPWFRINWEIKALVPIASVLLGGILLFLLATLSWRDPERHTVLLVAGAGAVAICGALLVVLTFRIQKPMVELQQKIAQLGEGDLNVAVSFAHR